MRGVKQAKRKAGVSGERGSGNMGRPHVEPMVVGEVRQPTSRCWRISSTIFIIVWPKLAAVAGAFRHISYYTMLRKTVAEVLAAALDQSLFYPLSRWCPILLLFPIFYLRSLTPHAPDFFINCLSIY